MNNILFVNDIRMKEFSRQMQDFKLPRWERLPELGLYMDQVVTIIENILQPILDFGGESFITSSMINNYVKLGILNKPEKKKYYKEHIACLLVITMLKQSYPISDVRYAINMVLRSLDVETAYNNFCEYIEYSVKAVADNILSSGDSIMINFGFSEKDAVVAMAAGSFAVKMFSLKMLEIARENDIPIVES